MYLVALTVLPGRVLVHEDAQVLKGVATNLAVADVDPRRALELMPVGRACARKGGKGGKREHAHETGVRRSETSKWAEDGPVRVRRETVMIMSLADLRMLGLSMISGRFRWPVSGVARRSLCRNATQKR